MLDPDELAYGRDLILACAARMTHWSLANEGIPIELLPDTIFVSREMSVDRSAGFPWLSVKGDG